MKVIATYNIKGGVGKTATAVNLAWLAAREGAPTLVWDLDPQGAASYYYRIKPKIKGGGKRLVQGKRDLDGFIRGTDYELLDLLPADFSYRNMDLYLEQTKKPIHQLHKLLRPFRSEYYYVFLDCPPSISLVSENIFDAADVVMVPTIPTTLSLRTYQQIKKFFKQQDLDTVKVLPFFPWSTGASNCIAQSWTLRRTTWKICCHPLFHTTVTSSVWAPTAARWLILPPIAVLPAATRPSGRTSRSNCPVRDSAHAEASLPGGPGITRCTN